MILYLTELEDKEFSKNNFNKNLNYDFDDDIDNEENLVNDIKKNIKD